MKQAWEATRDQPVFYEHLFLTGMGDSTENCGNCGEQLYYEGSVRWHNGDQINTYACDCEDSGRRKHVTITRAPEWNPFGGTRE